MEYGLCRKRYKKKKKILQERAAGGKDPVLSLFRFKDAEACTGGFSSECLVGRSILASLYKAILNDGTPVIIKRGIADHSARHYPAQIAIANELRIHATLNADAKTSKSFARLIGLSHSLDRPAALAGGGDGGGPPAAIVPGETLLVLQMPARGTLFDVLHRGDTVAPPLCLALRIHLAFAAAKCVKTLHYGHEIVHRDLRSTNFWIERDWSVRLANFSVAHVIHWEDQMPGCSLGSLGMLDPDWPQDGYLAAKVDVFCFGLLLAEIISNRKVHDVGKVPGDLVGWLVPLVRTNHVLPIVDPRLRLLPDHVKVPRELGRIAAMCLNPVARVRPTMSDVLERLRPLTQQFPFR